VPPLGIFGGVPSARSSRRAFAPSALSALRLNVSGKEARNTTSAGRFAQLFDRSAYAQHLTETTSRPTVNAAALNGGSVCGFTVAGQEKIGRTAFAIGATGKCHIFALVQYAAAVNGVVLGYRPGFNEIRQGASGSIFEGFYDGTNQASIGISPNLASASRFHLIECSVDGTSLRARADGTPYLPATAWGATALGSPYDLIVGCRAAGSQHADQQIAEIAIFDDAFEGTAAQHAVRRQLYAYFDREWSYRTATATSVLCDGDSLMFGSGSTSGGSFTVGATGTVPTAIQNALGSSAVLQTFAVGGDTIAMVQARQLAGSLLPRYDGNAKRNVRIVWCGINSIRTGGGQLAPDVAFAQYVAMIDESIACGYDTMPVTIAPTNYATTVAGARVTFNALLRAKYPSTYVDLDLVPELADPTNTTYFNADQLHLTDAGYSKAAAPMAAKLTALGWL
jgi:lysophospholipase L1-like esterase